MKELHVTTGQKPNQQTDIVQLDGILPDAKLTPKLARQAAVVAQGHGAGATVWDWEQDGVNGIGYRLYAESHRKLYCVDGNTYSKS